MKQRNWAFLAVDISIKEKEAKLLSACTKKNVTPITIEKVSICKRRPKIFLVLNFVLSIKKNEEIKINRLTPIFHNCLMKSIHAPFQITVVVCSNAPKLKPPCWAKWWAMIKRIAINLNISNALFLSGLFALILAVCSMRL